MNFKFSVSNNGSIWTFDLNIPDTSLISTAGQSQLSATKLSKFQIYLEHELNMNQIQNYSVCKQLKATEHQQWRFFITTLFCHLWGLTVLLFCLMLLWLLKQNDENKSITVFCSKNTLYFFVPCIAECYNFGNLECSKFTKSCLAHWPKCAAAADFQLVDTTAIYILKNLDNRVTIPGIQLWKYTAIHKTVLFHSSCHIPFMLYTSIS